MVEWDQVPAVGFFVTAPRAGMAVRPLGASVWLPGVATDHQHWVLASSAEAIALCGQVTLAFGWSAADWREWPTCPACRLAKDAE